MPYNEVTPVGTTIGYRLHNNINLDYAFSDNETTRQMINERRLMQMQTKYAIYLSKSKLQKLKVELNNYYGICILITAYLNPNHSSVTLRDPRVLRDLRVPSIYRVIKVLF